MKWKLFMRKLSVSAPRVTVRSQLPWPVKALLGFFVLSVAAAAGVAIYEYGRQFAGPDRRELQGDIERLRSQVREVTAERDRFAALAAAHDSQLKVERSAQEQLAKQVGALETESSRLKEDLAFFESLLPATAAVNAKGVVIRSFRVQTDDEAANSMRYRLLVQQAGKPERDFVGGLQLTVAFMHGGRSFTMSVPKPETASDETALALSFRHYQRVEGSFTLPAGAVARSVQVRIVANGEVRVQQSFNL